MSAQALRTPAAEAYAAAYHAQYVVRDLTHALRLYSGLVDSHSESREANYSRIQIQNIVYAVVPERDLREAQLALAIDHLGSAQDTSCR